MYQAIGEAALAVVLAGLTPGVEPRYALIIALAAGMSLAESLALSLAAVALLSITLTLAVDVVVSLSRRICSAWSFKANPACLYLKARERGARKLAPYLDKWGLAGLALFVALPLPATGMYTGAAAAALLGVRGVRLAAALAVGGSASVALMAMLAAAGIVALDSIS